MEREKVKKGLECLARKQEPMANPCSKCDYHDRPNFAFCVVDVATDALELLKEQEAVEPEFVRNEWRCGACGHVVLTYCFDINEGEMGKVMANYCPSCGRKVKWE